MPVSQGGEAENPWKVKQTQAKQQTCPRRKNTQELGSAKEMKTWGCVKTRHHRQQKVAQWRRSHQGRRHWSMRRQAMRTNQTIGTGGATRSTELPHGSCAHRFCKTMVMKRGSAEVFGPCSHVCRSVFCAQAGLPTNRCLTAGFQHREWPMMRKSCEALGISSARSGPSGKQRVRRIQAHPLRPLSADG